MKTFALDLGDRWVGTAISDPLGISCRPYETIEIDNLEGFLEKILKKESINTVVVGNPKTVSTGGDSDQTRKIVKLKQDLEQKFGKIEGQEIIWVLWDERLSSKRAEALKGRAKSKEEKIRSHSVAASFILQSYLDNQAFKRG
jgi:putative holliday junction resolvase